LRRDSVRESPTSFENSQVRTRDPSES
jgi:hypothetical protein